MSFGGSDVAVVGSFVDVVRGGDVAPLGGLVGVVEAGDVASLDSFVGGVGDGGCVDEPAPAWPRCGQSLGHLSAAVAAARVVDSGGSGERKDGTVTMCDMSDVSTAVARFGNSRASIINQH